jgi:hypothetical protein
LQKDIQLYAFCDAYVINHATKRLLSGVSTSEKKEREMRLSTIIGVNRFFDK